MEPEIIEFDNLTFGETDVFSFDFSQLNLIDGETLSDPSIDVTVIDGEDPSPNDIVQGSPLMDLDDIIASVRIKGLVKDVTYCLAMSVDTSESRHLTISARLKVVDCCN